MNRFLVLLLFLVFSSCKSDSDKNIKYILTPEQIRDLATPSDIVARIDFNSASSEYKKAILERTRLFELYNNVKFCDEALLKNPNDIYALVKRGKKLYEFKDYEKSLMVLNKVVKIRPDYQEAWFFIGKIYKDTHMDKNALFAFSKIPNSDSNYSKNARNMIEKINK